MIGLTDEEIKKAVGESWRAFPMKVFNTLTKAQIKKLLDWGELYCTHDNGGPSIKRWACPICRKELLEEVKE